MSLKLLGIIVVFLRIRAAHCLSLIAQFHFTFDDIIKDDILNDNVFYFPIPKMNIFSG